ncbi:MAG: hypothetical protein IPN61_12885 [Bacteroidetes bacterium]|nr:hypothetical protein [Bacteroidota bacterium]
MQFRNHICITYNIELIHRLSGKRIQLIKRNCGSIHCTGNSLRIPGRSHCNSGPTGYSSVQQFTTTGSGYCASSGVDATNDFIDLVYIGTMLNSTVSDSGYGDYTSMIINMTSAIPTT